MTPEEEEHVAELVAQKIGQQRKFNPKDWNEYYRFLIQTVFIGGALISFVSISVKAFFPDIVAIPERVENSEKTLVRISEQLEEFSSDIEEFKMKLNAELPDVIRFNSALGFLSSNEVYQGDSVLFTFLMSRVISCDSKIVVRFYNPSIRSIMHSYSYTIDTQKAQVSDEFRPFTISIRIPDDLPPGDYHYNPLIRHIDCAGYVSEQTALSQLFTVKSRGE